MKKYSKRNWNTLVIAGVLGLLYAGYLTDNNGGGLNSATLIAFGILIVMVAAILFVINKFG